MRFDILMLCGTIAGVMLFVLPTKELKGNTFEIALTALSVLITFYVLNGALPLIDYFNTFYNSDLAVCFKVLAKILGITLICNITSDMASDLGMGSLSGKVEFAGKIAVLLSSVPLFDLLISQLENFI